MRNGLRGVHRVMRRLVFSACLLVLLMAGMAFGEMKIIVAIAGKNLYATLEENPASRALYDRLPLTFNMRNMYGWQMGCMLPYAMPTGQLTSTNYKVGDIIYWPPRHTLAILYKQNGQRFQRQHLGHIDSGVEVFASAGDIEVTLAPYEEPPAEYGPPLVIDKPEQPAK